MIGTGTLINTAAIAAAGFVGHLFGKVFPAEKQESLTRTCGVSVIFIGIAGAMEGMLSIEKGTITSGRTMFIAICLALGTMIGELLNIENAFERFGEWLKAKTGNAKDSRFVDAFVTASLTVCIGAMAIVGSIQDGILGDFSTLAVKSFLDFVIIAIMCSAMGKGAAFSAVPVFLLQGSVTLLARLIEPIMTQGAIANISMIGAILIFCVGVNLVWGKRVSVANMLPSVILAVIADYLPFLK